MAHIIKPPHRLKFSNIALPSIFLGGSIDMGKAVDWQRQVEEALAPYSVNIYNPRRDNWNSGWEQRIDNAPFAEQVNWELDALEESDLILMYFDPNGPAPVSLLELGLFGIPNNDGMVVCCPEGYWRKGNVDIVCERYGIEQVPSLEQLIARAVEWAKEY